MEYSAMISKAEHRSLRRKDSFAWTGASSLRSWINRLLGFVCPELGIFPSLAVVVTLAGLLVWGDPSDFHVLILTLLIFLAVRLLCWSAVTLGVCLLEVIDGI